MNSPHVEEFKYISRLLKRQDSLGIITGNTFMLQDGAKFCGYTLILKSLELLFSCSYFFVMKFRICSDYEKRPFC